MNRDAMGDREVVEPHHDKMEQIDDHELWDTWVQERAYDTACTFFYHTNTMFNFANMIGRSRCVECSHGEVVSDFVKFIIHEDSLDGETSASISVQYAPVGNRV